MKILHVAVFTPTSTNVSQADGFETLGHEVIRYDYRARLQALGSMHHRDQELIDLCFRISPDIMLFSKCNGMDFRVLEECRNVTTTVMWYMDGLKGFNSEVRQKFVYSDFIFCSVRVCFQEAKKYSSNSYWHPCEGGYDSRIHYPMDIPKIFDVVFIGCIDGYILPYRRQLKNQVEFTAFDNIHNEQHAKTVSETKINLSLTDGVGISNRLYKLLGAGGFVLTMPFDTMDENFTSGKDFVVFNDPTDLKQKIKYYLEHEKEREVIALHGHNTVKKYDHIAYGKFILEKINDRQT